MYTYSIHFATFFCIIWGIYTEKYILEDVVPIPTSNNIDWIGSIDYIKSKTYFQLMDMYKT